MAAALRRCTTAGLGPEGLRDVVSAGKGTHASKPETSCEGVRAPDLSWSKSWDTTLPRRHSSALVTWDGPAGECTKGVRFSWVAACTRLPHAVALLMSSSLSERRWIDSAGCVVHGDRHGRRRRCGKLMHGVLPSSRSFCRPVHDQQCCGCRNDLTPNAAERVRKV